MGSQKLGPWYGGVQNVWGEENVPENALSRKFLEPSKRASGLLCRGFLYRETQSTDTWGGWKTYRTRGGPKPLFGRGVIREVFLPPLFSTPPWRPLRVGVIFPFLFAHFSPFFTHFSPCFTHFFPFSSLFSASPEGQGQTTAIYCKNGEFHSNPICTDPVQNFPMVFQKGACSPGTKTGNRNEGTLACSMMEFPGTKKPERGHVRQNHPFGKPPFWQPPDNPRCTTLHEALQGNLPLRRQIGGLCGGLSEASAGLCGAPRDFPRVVTPCLWPWGAVGVKRFYPKNLFGLILTSKGYF